MVKVVTNDHAALSIGGDGQTKGTGCESKPVQQNSERARHFSSQADLTESVDWVVFYARRRQPAILTEKTPPVKLKWPVQQAI